MVKRDEGRNPTQRKEFLYQYHVEGVMSLSYNDTVGVSLKCLTTIPHPSGSLSSSNRANKRCIVSV